MRVSILVMAQAFCVFIVLWVSGVQAQETVVFNPAEQRIIKSLTSAKNTPVVDPSNAFLNNLAAKKLGKALFFDARLSANGKVACVSCHDFAKSTTDAKRFAQGIGQGTRNTPTLINVFMNRWFFWDGRADSLWLQALGPIESKLEMGGSWPAIYQLFITDKNLLVAYNTIFINTPLNPQQPFVALDANRFKTNIGKALAAFEVDITQFNSRFDVFAQTLPAPAAYTLLNNQELAGLKIFIGKGNCLRCHLGPNFSDGEFHNIRLISQVNNPKDSGRYGAIDSLKSNPHNLLGAYADINPQDATARNFVAKTQYLTATTEQWAAYKTPTLRNIEYTAPYMHDGSKSTLKAVIEHYSDFTGAAPAHHTGGLLEPINLTLIEQAQLEAFLKTLTGEVNIPSYF